MKLRSKVTATLAIAFGLFIAADLSIQQFVVLPSFIELERTHARTNVDRTREAIERETEHLGYLSRDWGTWDDTYQFVVGENDDYAAANLNPVTMEEAELDVLVISDVSGQLIHAACIDAESREPLHLPFLDHEAFPAGHPFRLAADAREGRSGVLQTSVGPLLFAVTPILTSEGKGPSRGTVAMGRFLVNSRVQEIAVRAHLRATLHAPDGTDLPEPLGPALAALRKAPFDVAIEDTSEKELTALAFIRDIHGQPARLLRVDVDRDITSRGNMAMSYAHVALAAAAFFAFSVIMILLQKIVIGPLAHLTEGATVIGETGDLTRSVAMARSDEIGVLSHEVDAMVQRLAESRRAFMDAAREAGMAEVASGVLHNVGNVLNSLNVSAGVLVDGAKSSELARLDELTQLLEAHPDDLPEFLAVEGRAQHLRDFVKRLAEQRRMEARANLAELTRLQGNIDHIAHVVGSQQAMVRGITLNEPVSLAELTREAVTLVDPTYRRHKIELVVKLGTLPTMTLDRVRFVQVLVNILTNAKDALKSHHQQTEPRVELSVRHADAEGIVRIEISDNGMGIDAATLPQLFTQGFTTKEQGSGIGLHFCAVAVKCMNGHISVHSDGSGQGTTFSIELATDGSKMDSPVPLEVSVD